MTKIIDGVIKEWGDNISSKINKGRKGRNIGGGKVSRPSPKKPVLKARGRLVSTVRKSPEVMVKISGAGKSMGQIKAHMDYISRRGDVEVEDERGDIYSGSADMRDLSNNWRDAGYRITPENGTKREAFNIVLSMPGGTDRASVKNAARDFAAAAFEDHQYVFAAHEDEKHPHVHLAVKAVDSNGIRLNPRKADLQLWREMFADKLNDHGIDANATPRAIRGVVKKAEKQVIRHINKDFKSGRRTAPAKTTKEKIKDAGRELKTGQGRKNPAEENILKTRQSVYSDYEVLAKALAKGDQKDKDLAKEIVSFVKSMPAIKTLHQETVETLMSKHKILEHSKDNALGQSQATKQEQINEQKR